MHVKYLISFYLCRRNLELPANSGRLVKRDACGLWIASVLTSKNVELSRDFRVL